MTDVNDTELDLGLDVIQRKKKKNSNTYADAGANANSMADVMNFLGSDTLAELVWSPQTGLHVKFAQNKPCYMREEGPNEMRCFYTPNEQHVASLVTRQVSGDPYIESAQVGILENEIDEKYDANISTKRKRECNFEQIFGCKRIKKQVDECIGSSVLTNRCSQESLDYNAKNEKTESLVKQVSLYGKEAPMGMFDTIRRLRLSRTDIHKLMNYKLSVAQLDGFFLRLRVAKGEEGVEGSRYYVACITGLQWETPWKNLNQPIRVKVGGVECFVESQHVSNCDFLEDELIAWWRKTSRNHNIPVVKDLKSKLAVRRTLGV